MNVYEVREEMLTKRTRLSDYNLRVVYYARVSTDKYDQLHSLKAQKQHFEDMMRHYPNWTFICGYVDEGLTGTSVDKRESFLEMIKDAQTGKFDLICTKEVSRFARNTLDTLTYTRDLVKYGVAVYFEYDNICTADSDSDYRLAQMASQAQEESRKTSERLKFGFREAVKKGSVLGNNNIWGYRKDKSKLVIVPEEAEMVRKIFDLYVSDNLGIRAIAKVITEMGYRNSNGNAFSFSSVKGMLTNPKYKGFYCGNKTHKVHFLSKEIERLPKEEWIMYEDNEKIPPIVSAEIWDKANRKLTERSRKLSGEDKTSYQNKYLYSGKIICGEHNVCYHHTTYKYRSGNKELWACKEYGNGNKCRNPIVYSSEMDAVMHEVYDRIVLEKNAIVNDLIELYKESGSTKAIVKAKHKIQADINTVLAKKDKLLDLVMDDRITNEEFEQRNNEFNMQLDKLRAKLSELDEKERKSLDLKESIEGLRTSIANELVFTEDIGKSVVDSFIDKIVVYKSKEENRIDLKIFLKLLPDTAQNYTENPHILNFGSGRIVRIRGGNSRSKKAYELTFNYDLCYYLE
ncbi:MAG: recombinase family protein [Ruminococcaceae bacterium]|nr:recombinase family protein [Oscillospiraceae bacterium]